MTVLNVFWSVTVLFLCAGGWGCGTASAWMTPESCPSQRSMPSRRRGARKGDLGTCASIILALLCSLFISLTFIPLAVAKFLPAKHIAFVGDKTRKHKLRDRYMKTVGWSVRHPFVVGFVIAPVLMAAAFFHLNIRTTRPKRRTCRISRFNTSSPRTITTRRSSATYVGPVEKYLLANKEKMKIKDVSTWYNNNSASHWVSFEKEQSHSGTTEGYSQGDGERPAGNSGRRH